MTEESNHNEYLIEVLQSIGKDYDILTSTFTSKDNFSVVLYTKLLDGNTPSHACDLWKEEFAKRTNTGWTVRYTFPSPIKFVYRKVYECHHSKKNKSKNEAKAPKYSKYRNKNCDATIDIKLLKVTKDTYKKHKHIQMGLNACIKIKFQHSHRVENAEAYSFLRMSKDTEGLFISYFDNGLTPATAKSYHENDIMDNNDVEMDAIMKILADASKNPLDTQVHGLYNKYRSGQFGGRSETTVLEKLKEKQNEYAERGIEIKIHEDPLCVAIVTPLMRRGHSISCIQDICFVDSSGSCDQTGTVSTFMYGCTKVGGLPLGVVLHTGQSEENYTIAFKLLKELLGPTSFNNTGSPNVIMTDDSKAEKNALHKVFPNATLLLCIFHVLQALWRWLLESKNKIDKDHRPYLIRLVKNIMFAPSEVEYDVEKMALEIDSIVQLYPNFLCHVQNMITRDTEWCICFRANLTTKGHNTNNIVESSIRIFKDCILMRCKAFNMVALIHFTAQTLENYHMRRLLAFAGSRRNKNHLVYNNLLKKSKNLEVLKISEFEYHVKSSQDSIVLYQVYTDVEQCTCFEGIGGKFCKHLCAVQEKYNLNMFHSPQLSVADKKILAALAVGINNVDASFYEGMDGTNAIEYATILPQQSSFNETIIDSDLQVTESERCDDLTQLTTELDNHFSRLLELSKNSTKNNVNKLCEKLKKIKTLSQFDEFCHSKLSTINKRGTIPVQSTAISRRKKRPGLATGAMRMQSGRPSNDEQVSAPKKRKRNLALSIRENQANAKSHGKNH